MKHSKYLIYALVDPRDGETRYVGKSCSGLNRPRQHRSPCVWSRGRSWCARWVRQLIRAETTYAIEVLYESPTPAGLTEAERFWISELRRRGFRLTNLTDGGEGWSVGMQHTPETKRKIGDAHRGRKHSPEHVEKMAASKRGKTQTEEHRRKNGDAHRGRKLPPMSAEQRAALSAARKGKPGTPRTPEMRARSSAAQKKTPIVGVHCKTGEMIRFESLAAARRAGFQPRFGSIRFPRKYVWTRQGAE